MPSFTTALALLAVGAGLGLLLTRFARRVATRVGMLDGADNHRKTQTTPVPVAGGLAVLVAAVLALSAVALVEPEIAAVFTADPPRTFALLAAAVLITLVGFADDCYNLRARHKLLGQTVAILVLVVGGDFVIERLGLFWWVFELGPLAVPVTVLWLLACVNALNLIDGMDGLLGTVGGIALVSLAVMAALTGHVFAFAVALALAGAVFGFLWWNLPPATVYMGDAGSMLIGLVIGAVAVPARLKGPATVALLTPLAVLVLPMLDTTAAVVRRKLTGRGLATTDRGHLHHKMLERGLSPRRVLVVAAGLGLVAAAGALASAAWNNDAFALVAAVGVVATLLACKLFGNAELGLIRTRAAAMLRKLWAGVGDVHSFGLAVRLQGTADWDLVWAELVSHARRLDLHNVCLDVNAPVMHENYHARWANPSPGRRDRVLQIVIPLVGRGDASLGQLTLAVSRDARPLSEVLATFAGMVEVIENRAATLPVPIRPQPEPATPEPAPVRV